MSSSDFEPLPQIDVESLPQCPRCKEGLLRPGIVWFGEPLPLIQMDKVDNFFIKGSTTSFASSSILPSHKIDLILVIGTSGKVWPAMSYVERCKQNGGKIAIFNTEIEDIEAIKKDKSSWGFQGEAAYWLPRALAPIIGCHIRPRDKTRRWRIVSLSLGFIISGNIPIHRLLLIWHNLLMHSYTSSAWIILHYIYISLNLFWIFQGVLYYRHTISLSLWFDIVLQCSHTNEKQLYEIDA